MPEYKLQEVDEPNLVEDVFPHGQIPRINFDGKIVETIDGEPVEFDPVARCQADIHLTDTTFRDGQQSRPP